MTPDEFRRFGHMLIDWIADYHTRVEGPAGDVPGGARGRARRGSRRLRPSRARGDSTG
jgi:hypothetical protein